MVLGLFLAMAAPARGQITTDGTVGPALSLTGPDFEIGADLGAIVAGAVGLGRVFNNP